MSKETLVFTIGLLIVATPFLGVPTEWKKWLLIGVGVILMIVGYALRRSAFLQSLEQENGERRTDVFAENQVHTPSSDQQDLVDGIRNI